MALAPEPEPEVAKKEEKQEVKWTKKRKGMSAAKKTHNKCSGCGKNPNPEIINDDPVWVQCTAKKGGRGGKQCDVEVVFSRCNSKTAGKPVTGNLHVCAYRVADQPLGRTFCKYHEGHKERFEAVVVEHKTES